MIRVLLADDQSLVRAGLRSILQVEPDMEVVAEACSGDEALQLVPQLQPDVVLMDIRMPGVDGLEATRRLRAQPDLEQVRIVVLTTFDLDEYVYQALQCGAHGFAVKDIPDQQLVAGIRAVVSGDALFSPTVTRRLIETYTRVGPGRTTAGADALTPREREVWRLITRGMSNDEIATTLFIGTATAKTHVARVLTKLGARDRIAAVVLGHQNGLA